MDGDSMCPHCGWVFPTSLLPSAHPLPGLVPLHGSPGPLPSQPGCPGTGQVPRNPESDRRRLWKDGGEP